METNPHNLSNLLLQLGLSTDIDAFVASHRLPKGVVLADAPFWSPAQSDLIKQALANDSDWAEAADELATRLS